MGSIGDVSKRLARLEARRNINPEAHLPDKLKTRIRVSRLYTRWITERFEGNDIPPPELEPEEVHYWQYSELIADLVAEIKDNEVAGYPRADISPELQARFNAWRDQYGDNG